MSSSGHSKNRGWAVYLSVVTAMLAVGYFVLSPQKLFKPGDDIGYNMGVVGGLMMVFLLLYPLRKRVSFLNKFGVLPAWFKWHMVFGIMGPALIVLHSTFHINSVNAAVAMVCMLLVSGSGTFGRFFYTKIHHGLYGRQATVNELKLALEQSGDVKSVFSFAPGIEKALEDFRVNSKNDAQASGIGFVNFIRAGIQGRMLAGSLTKELQQIMHAKAKQGDFTPAQRQGMEVLFNEYRAKIDAYLGAVRDAAQFHTYERLFSYWHIFHIPLVYMMVFSAVYHVYAVHAY